MPSHESTGFASVIVSQAGSWHCLFYDLRVAFPALGGA